MPTRVPPFGPSSAKIMLVGEAPGLDEEKLGRPFVGKAGQDLRQYLMEVGIDPESIFYTNLCKYRPPNNKLEAFYEDGGIPQLPVLEGLVELAEEINRVAPNIIIAAGNFPMRHLTGKGKWVDYWKDNERIRGFTGIGDWRGSVLPCIMPGAEDRKVICTYHPSAVLRDKQTHPTFKGDLAKAKEECNFPEIRRKPRTVYLVEQTRILKLDKEDPFEYQYGTFFPTADYSPESLREELLSTEPNEYGASLTTDIEYLGKKLICVGITNHSSCAAVVPTRNVWGIEYTRSILMSGVGLNAQNSMFDASILEWWYDMAIMQFIKFDTMLAAYASYIELPKALEYLLSVFTDIPFHKWMMDWETAKIETITPIVYPYNGIDVFGQHEVMEEQIKYELTDPAVRRSFEFGMQLLQPLWDMSKRGIRIDFDQMKRVIASLNEEEAEKNILLLLLCGAPLNVKSGPQVSNLLFNRLGLPPTKKQKKPTKAGEPVYKVDDKSLAALLLKSKTEEQRRAITLIRQCRKARDLKSKFFEIEFDEDSRIRGHYDPTKTVTGRLASRKFYPTGRGANQQNIPRDKRARRVFVADRGKVFCYADLERAESLVVAHLTGDPRMLADHAPGVDAHRSLAAALFDLPIEEIDDDMRYVGKQTRHAGNYMQGWLTFMTNFNKKADETGISIDAKRAKFLVSRYKELHPFLPRWWKGIEAQLWKTRTLFNLVGRKRTFYSHISSILPEAIAYIPQSTVGDVLNMGFLNMEGRPCDYVLKQGEASDKMMEEIILQQAEELRSLGYEALMQIHDAVAFQVNAADVDRACELVTQLMSIPLVNPRTYEEFSIPVEILVDIDPEHIRTNTSNWGDVKAWHTANV